MRKFEYGVSEVCCQLAFIEKLQNNPKVVHDMDVGTYTAKYPNAIIVLSLQPNEHNNVGGAPDAAIVTLPFDLESSPSFTHPS
jgi:hypothetical protein